MVRGVHDSGVHGSQWCVCGRDACMAGGMRGSGGMFGRGMCVVGRGHVVGDMHGGGACMAAEMATAVGGTQPTGMHSC